MKRGFSLFEVIVAIFIFLVGVMGVVATFGAGIRARLIAQELLISQDLAQKWYEWVAFRVNDTPAAGSLNNSIPRASLSEGLSGDFYQNSGDFYAAPPESRDNPPTYQCSVYRNWKWTVTDVDHDYRPRWEDRSGGVHDWTQSLSGARAVPGGVGAPPQSLTEVELTVSRGARQYRFHFLFSGVGKKYD